MELTRSSENNLDLLRILPLNDYAGLQRVWETKGVFLSTLAQAL